MKKKNKKKGSLQRMVKTKNQNTSGFGEDKGSLTLRVPRGGYEKICLPALGLGNWAKRESEGKEMGLGFDLPSFIFCVVIIFRLLSYLSISTHQ